MMMMVVMMMIRSRSSTDLRFLTVVMKTEVNRQLSVDRDNVTIKVKPSWFTCLVQQQSQTELVYLSGTAAKSNRAGLPVCYSSKVKPSWFTCLLQQQCQTELVYLSATAAKPNRAPV